MIDLMDYFDWIVNEREPYPSVLSRKLHISAITGRLRGECETDCSGEPNNAEVGYNG